MITQHQKTIFSKTVNIGKDPHGASVFLEVEITEHPQEHTTTGEPITRLDVNLQPVTSFRELSIMGSYKHGGGQMQDTIRKEYAQYKEQKFSPATMTRILNIWDTYHGGGTTPRCIHQRGPEWEARDVTFTTYSPEWDFVRGLERHADLQINGSSGHRDPFPLDLSKIENLQRAAKRSSAAKTLLTLRELGLAPFRFTRVEPIYFQTRMRQVIPCGMNEFEETIGKYFKKQDETKSTSWLSEQEGGFLSKPCPTCGYKYGSAWLVTHLPEEIEREIIELLSFAPPDTPEHELEETLRQMGVSWRIVKQVNQLCPLWCEEENGEHKHGHHYIATFWRKDARKRFTVNFWDSMHAKEAGTEPDVSAIMGCLTWNNPGSFKDFCAEMGESEDSRAAERTYKAVLKEWKRVSSFFSEAEREQVAA